MAIGDLTTLANVEQWLSLASGNSSEPLLARLISAVSTLVQNYLQRTIASAEYTETYNAPGGRTLFLRNGPVTAVSALSIGPRVIQAGGVNPWTMGYTFDQNSIYLLGLEFGRGIQSISVTYTAGYASTPLDIEQAVIELVSLRFNEITRIGLVSKSQAGETTMFTQADMTASIKTALNPYRRVVPL